MTLSDEDSIERLALRFLDRSLPKSEWSHEAHFAVALWTLRHRPDLTTPDEFRRLITTYNEATNMPNTDSSGYHHTITLASLRASRHHFGNYAPDTPLCTAHGDLIASALGNPDWLLSHWRRDTLFSVRARRAWVDPDLAALAF